MAGTLADPPAAAQAANGGVPPQRGGAIIRDGDYIVFDIFGDRQAFVQAKAKGCVEGQAAGMTFKMGRAHGAQGVARVSSRSGRCPSDNRAH